MLFLHSLITLDRAALLSNVREIHCQQKLALHIINNKGKYEYRRELLRSRKILNVYQVSILKNVTFMHKTKMSAAPNVFLSKFRKPSHSYPTTFSVVNYVEPTYKLSIFKYRISVRGPYLWSSCLVKKSLRINIRFQSSSKIKIA